jgi:hypothetical protein
MTSRPESRALLGRTIRWCFTDGPVAGRTFEHTFNTDGSVVWRGVDGKEPTKLHHEKFGAVAPISDDVVVVSYVSANGITLTVALNLALGQMVGFASGHDTWAQQKGTFELLPEPA